MRALFCRFCKRSQNLEAVHKCVSIFDVVSGAHQIDALLAHWVVVCFRCAEVFGGEVLAGAFLAYAYRGSVERLNGGGGLDPMSDAFD